MAWHPYLEPQLVQSDLTRPISHDRFGHRLHLALALLFCLLLPGPMSVAQFAGVPLIIFFALRTPNIWRTWGSFAVQPVFIAFVAFTAWQAISLAWSPNTDSGLRELSDRRWLWAMWVLWPIMMHRPALIAALAIGFLAGNIAQLLHEIGLRANISALVWPRLPHRNSGWWDPVVGGSVLVAALGLHLPAAVMGAGRARLLALLAAAITLLAIFATGTRGAWIAAAALVGIVVTVALTRGVMHARRTKLEARSGLRAASPALVFAATLLVAGAIGWMAVGESVLSRISEARTEVARAQEGDYQTFTGGRMLMGSWAAEAFRQHPIGGVGAGGYKSWTHQQLEARGESHLAPLIHSHAHNTPLHIAATSGAVGLALALLTVALALRGGLRDLARPRAGDPGDGLGTYSAGPAFALVGLLLVGMFDAVHLNAQTSALMTILMGLCLISRPRLPDDGFARPPLPATTIAERASDTPPPETLPAAAVTPGGQSEGDVHVRNLPQVQ
jgi:O-antigen ligase